MKIHYLKAKIDTKSIKQIAKSISKLRKLKTIRFSLGKLLNLFFNYIF